MERKYLGYLLVAGGCAIGALGCSDDGGGASQNAPSDPLTMQQPGAGSPGATVGPGATPGASGVGVMAPGVGAATPGSPGAPGVPGGAPGAGTAGAAAPGVAGPAPGATMDGQSAPGMAGGDSLASQPVRTCLGTPPPNLVLTKLADGLVGPTHVAQAPGDPTRLYVTEQRGTVRVLENGKLVDGMVLDLRSPGTTQVNAEAIFGYVEGGLLAIVFDPEFESSKRLWLSYTTPGPSYTLAEFRMETPGTIDPATFKEVLKFKQYAFTAAIPQATNHVGSMVAFGPDGYLYLSRGDGGGENDNQNSGQDTSDDLCSILRIDPDNPGQPVDGNLDGHVWSYGFRNPWRFSFDRANGDMYIGDVGQDQGTGYEEINVEPANTPGRNYGWRAVDILGLPAQGPCSGGCGGTTGPALAYSITPSANSVIGGYVYRGAAIPALQGRYLWADWTERKVKTFIYEGEEDGQPKICDEYDTGLTVPDKVRSFGEGLDGEIYVLAGGQSGAGIGGVDTSGAALDVPGQIYRIDPGEGASAAVASPTTPDTGTPPTMQPSFEPGSATFGAIYGEILTASGSASCVAGFCHGGAPSASSNGNLQMLATDKETTYKNLVGPMSSSAMCSGMPRVVPGDADGSLLMQKLGPNPPCGERMPVGMPLTDEQLAQIRAWIDNGAMND